MHSRSDRDKYLTVNWNNIQGNMKREFFKNGVSQNRIFGPFDYDSIMLYGSRLFSWNGRDTMSARRRGVQLRDTAQKFGLSKMDIQNINILYGCNKPKTPKKKGRSG